MWLALFIFLTGAVAAAIAAVTGFGIGSLLTPALGLGLGLDTRTAVAAVSIPHLAGTALRFWTFRHDINRRVLWRFGWSSATGGLIGALLQTRASTPGLTILFGTLLMLVAVGELTGVARRIRFHGAVAFAAGGVSGLLGGLVGNQGGIRSGALLGFDLQKREFVATATAVGLLVDAARMPVYLFTAGVSLQAIAVPILIATSGVIVGTVLGGRLLRAVPESAFRVVVALLLAVLGAVMLIEGVHALM